ncbi:MAG: 1-deoxy-D-xylulose-5-phosphate reductoisomerase [Alphaproteobacteria bacterium]|nr:1-deoxy-D-xylulose-5-phosphate reductoisomerase [Alphaproteobacteria bacterium]MCL2504893.1 1-deoxy-D-xylulose-5-phosphate reductoisomerase [Alphaproteobacteria bacterium]
MQRTNPKTISILGSTGSVGQQTIDLITRNIDKYDVVALTANKSAELLAKQAKSLNAKIAVIGDEQKYKDLKDALAGTGIKAASGASAIAEAAAMDSELTVSAIVGAAGLPGTLEAVKRGKTIAFANKETLVCAGSLMMNMVKQTGATLLPVDSEHNAIYQVFDFNHRDGINKIILTASGGSFRDSSLEEMAAVTPEEAVKHPVWSMGAKISVDSSTMMNKALEVIEAHFLFQMPADKIEVLIHPQSIIHSMVEYKDGSILAQLGSPDMRTPIGYCLAYPERMETPVPKLDLAAIGKLTFEKPDLDKFPTINFAYEALEKGGTAPAIINAANEVAVDAFLDHKVGFLDISRLVGEMLHSCKIDKLTDLKLLHEVDAAVRRKTSEKVLGM